MFGIKKIKNELKDLKEQNQTLIDQITASEEKIYDIEKGLSHTINENKSRNKIDQLSLLNHSRLNNIMDTYSLEINEMIHKRVEEELNFTDVLGNLVRYQGSLDKLFPIVNPSKKIVVTSTMSAGKSTVINSIIGKEILKSRNEATTGKIYHILNSSTNFEGTNRLEDELERNCLDQQVEFMSESKSANEIYLSTKFSNSLLEWCPLEVIDTPGINFSGNDTDQAITYDYLQEKKYDLLIYVINATQNGTVDDEENLKKLSNESKPIIFILNKLDEFNLKKDSIETSITETKSHLLDLGFNNPQVIPMSAYAGLLAKKVSSDKNLSEFEEEDFNLLCKKFNRYTSFNLGSISMKSDKIEQAEELIRNSGLKKLEEIIQGILYP